ncbi:fatty acid desaturase domain-containing protein [Ditylenchus destructor]|uniref:Fatty acid desaturase domain-containing protein n=1 Tax=Ditylenchus destructor TaxID=166010 RepID=A0AAD4N0W9_9BILA|nr:fatty acid desaturase domain-containing protein [Ditylenchus destructor]
MVLREHSDEDFYIRIDGKWILVDRQLLSSHPGGSAMTTYKNLDATTVFHTFHANSKPAYKMLKEVVDEQKDKNIVTSNLSKLEEENNADFEDVNMGTYNLTKEEMERMCKNFDQLRFRVRQMGLLNGQTTFFFRKFIEAVTLICISLWLQHCEYYVVSALVMGLAWQQLGWMIHEYCHHQHFKEHFWNDIMSYVVGNMMQGFSSGGWKEQHNVHHAATNVVGRDGDLDLMPLWATVASDLSQLIDKSVMVYLIPYQHLYWTLLLPFLRLSWLAQSILFVSQMHNNFYEIYRRRARIEQITLTIHWSLVALQYYFLPTFQIRVMYFLVSQLFGGFLIAHVVTYNHYSTDKFPRIFIDWLWGGLNYQIEHHLFPTMPRNNLKKVMPLVQEFCRENNLPYMVDDYFTGWKYEIEQFRRVAKIAAEKLQRSA